MVTRGCGVGVRMRYGVGQQSLHTRIINIIECFRPHVRPAGTQMYGLRGKTPKTHALLDRTWRQTEARLDDTQRACVLESM